MIICSTHFLGGVQFHSAFCQLIDQEQEYTHKHLLQVMRLKYIQLELISYSDVETVMVQMVLMLR